MNLLKTTHKKFIPEWFKYKVTLSNNLSYEKCFKLLVDKGGPNILVQVYERDENEIALHKSVTEEKYIYQVYCNTRPEKRAIDKASGKKLSWIEIKKKTK